MLSLSHLPSSDCCLAQVKIKLKGHQKRVTGLAFSSVLNILVSSAADAQVCPANLRYSVLQPGFYFVLLRDDRYS